MILEIRRGVAKNRERTVAEPMFLVGTGRDCDMVLGDPQFGQIHFYLLSQQGQVSLRSITPQPEVTVNGQVRHHGPVNDGDRIRTGPYEFLLKSA